MPPKNKRRSTGGGNGTIAPGAERVLQQPNDRDAIIAESEARLGDAHATAHAPATAPATAPASARTGRAHTHVTTYSRMYQHQFTHIPHASPPAAHTQTR